MTVFERAKGKTLARFLISLPTIGPVSDQRTANGRVRAGVKKVQTKI
jgi:hypothetical protein